MRDPGHNCDGTNRSANVLRDTTPRPFGNEQPDYDEKRTDTTKLPVPNQWMTSPPTNPDIDTPT